MEDKDTIKELFQRTENSQYMDMQTKQEIKRLEMQSRVRQAEYEKNLRVLAEKLAEIAENPLEFAEQNPLLLSLYEHETRGMKVMNKEGKWVGPLEHWLLIREAITSEFNKIASYTSHLVQLTTQFSHNDGPFEVSKFSGRILDVKSGEGESVYRRIPTLIVTKGEGNKEYWLDNILTNKSHRDGLIELEVRIEKPEGISCALYGPKTENFPSAMLARAEKIASDACSLWIREYQSRR